MIRVVRATLDPQRHKCVARIFARVLEFDLRLALDLPAATERAAEMRRLIVLECFLHRPDLDGFAADVKLDQIILADDCAAAIVTQRNTLTLAAPPREDAALFVLEETAR